MNAAAAPLKRDDSEPGAPVDFHVDFDSTQTSVDSIRITVDINHDVDTWEDYEAVLAARVV